MIGQQKQFAAAKNVAAVPDRHSAAGRVVEQSSRNASASKNNARVDAADGLACSGSDGLQEILCLR